MVLGISNALTQDIDKTFFRDGLSDHEDPFWANVRKPAGENRPLIGVPSK
jgi:hypothetical protein